MYGGNACNIAEQGCTVVQKLSMVEVYTTQSLGLTSAPVQEISQEMTFLDVRTCLKPEAKFKIPRRKNTDSLLVTDCRCC